MKKYIFFTSLIILGYGFFEVYKNFYLFYAKYEQLKLKIVEKRIVEKNNKIEENLKSGFYNLGNEKFIYKEYPLEEYGVKFSNLIDLKPIGYFDTYEEKIIFMSNDGNIYSTNNIDEIKKGNFSIIKLSDADENLKLDPNDEYSYRNIKIRDILIQNKIFLLFRMIAEKKMIMNITLQ